ncbi:Hypothetical protein SMA_0040 [Streptococcus macedonicus ACA-DC 198]|nr:Hypothetical protein SMA_0040 [Streptococcus macedonicus ACA-DC 198]SCA88600.1 hypothetical protein SMA679_0039 [Streptococcus macedonicus]
MLKQLRIASGWKSSLQSKRQKVPNQLCMGNSKLTKVGNRCFNIF